MDFRYKLQLLGVAFLLGTCIYTLLGIFLFQDIPSPYSITMLALCWVITLKFNDAWHDLWKKWTKK